VDPKVKNRTIPHPLLDGAAGSGASMSKESLQLSSIVKDPSLSLIDRVESFEDIINIEVGDTSFTRARNLEREADLKQVYLKFEGGNPTGTQKDRIAFAQCHDALRRGFTTITVATCGNYGAAVAFAAQLAGLECIIYIPEEYHTHRTSEMINCNADVRRVKGSYEDSVLFSTQIASEKEWYDANPGGNNTPLQISAYSEIAYEIYDQLHDAPKMVAVPVSNGTLLAGVYRGFVSLYKRGRTSRIPRMVAASTYKKNPIIYSFRKGLDTCTDLDQTKIRESKINEPLINWHSFDGDEALWALKESNGFAFDISDDRMQKYAKLLKEKEGLHVLPASTTGLIALLEMNAAESFENDRYVAIITGRK
jgi:threonine synthase